MRRSAGPWQKNTATMMRPRAANSSPSRRLADRVMSTAPRKMPVGRNSSTMTRMTKATVSLYSVGTSDRSSGSCQPPADRPLSGLRTVVQLNTASVSAKPTRKPPAMAP